MAEYRVLVQEVHVSHRIVEADSEAEALEKANDAEEVDLEYSHTLDKEAWTVEGPEEEDCWDCRGTGIGNPHVDNSRCPTCGGSGVPRRERDSEPPSEPPESYRG